MPVTITDRTAQIRKAFWGSANLDEAINLKGCLRVLGREVRGKMLHWRNTPRGDAMMRVNFYLGTGLNMIY
jgi:hypothetical protein